MMDWVWRNGVICHAGKGCPGGSWVERRRSWRRVADFFLRRWQRPPEANSRCGRVQDYLNQSPTACAFAWEHFVYPDLVSYAETAASEQLNRRLVSILLRKRSALLVFSMSYFSGMSQRLYLFLKERYRMGKRRHCNFRDDLQPSRCFWSLCQSKCRFLPGNTFLALRRTLLTA